ncbi:TraR/DksA C4-type zinc finger protein [Dyella terrae]|uniref:TraR/DksA C4-type zinc finger protein n=1 Tax=Dyella terrae TaxID=522259 RepID=UPI003D1895B8
MRCCGLRTGAGSSKRRTPTAPPPRPSLRHNHDRLWTAGIFRNGERCVSDDMDRAQESEAADRERALRLAAERIAASFEPRKDGIEGLCIDCDLPIEPARLIVLAGKTSRCASCAHDYEQRKRMHGR